MTTITLVVPGMNCRACVRAVTARLRDLPGVVTVRADAETAELSVSGEVSEREVREALAGAGYAAGG